MPSKVLTAVVFVVFLILPSVSPLAHGGGIEVVASHSILADVVRNVAGDNAEVSALIPIGADPHSFIPTPGDLTSVARADLVITNGAGFEEGLLDMIQSAGETANIVSASDCIEVRPLGAGMLEAEAEADDGHGHEEEDAGHEDDEADDEHGHEDDEADDEQGHEDDEAEDEAMADDGHEDDGHTHGDASAIAADCEAHDAELAMIVGDVQGRAPFLSMGRGGEVDCGGGHGHGGEADAGHGHDEPGACDPHFWLDPHNVIYWTLAIRDSLSAMDPDNEATYAANAAAYAQEVADLETEFILPLLETLPLEKRVLVTSHDFLGYVASTYRFDVITTVVPGVATMVEPSPRDIAVLIDVVRSAGVSAIFDDSFAPARIVQAIVSETGAMLVGLYSDTVSESDGPAPTYLEYMRYNMNTIVSALRGDG